MDYLKEKFRKKVSRTSLSFIRSIINDIEWESRLTGIKGARGVGKTTLILQYIKKYHQRDDSVLYVSLDDIWFSDHRLTELTDDFVKKGGQFLFLDEVHKYPDWSIEIKNIYDDYPELHIVFTASSMLEILDARADLSRRAIVYKMQGLSFREYLNFTQRLDLKRYSLEDIIANQYSIEEEILQQMKPLRFFQNYLEKGYYPFFKESTSLYYARIEEIINMITEVELPLLRGVDISFSQKLKKLLLMISESAPFIPNISKLSERIGINRNTLISYLHFLQEADLTKNIYKDASGISRMQKPDKIFLENTNLAHAINPFSPDMGNIRETFFLNQLQYDHKISYPDKGDFVIDDEWLFEIGGQTKGLKQLAGWKKEKAFAAVDDIEYGYDRRIPLWLFGFLY
jgi:predicted AAA+ superfamily ATPase